jgi:hypothetical protein
LPRVEALDKLRGGARKVGALPSRLMDRVRSGGDAAEEPAAAATSGEPSATQDRIEAIRDNPWIAVGIAAGGLLVLAWIGWAIYVTSENGADAGLGVVIAWPAMLAALALISLPFIGGYLLVRRLSDGEGSTAAADGETSEDEGSDEEPKDSAEEEGEDEEDDDSDEESDDDSESDPEAEAAKS